MGRPSGRPSFFPPIEVPAMNLVAFRRGLVLAALSLPACLPAAAQNAKPPATPAPEVSDAGLQARIGAMFRKGMTALAASRQARTEEERDALLDEAIAAFRKALVANPGLVRLRLELARAFFLKGEDTLAKRHFEQVLAGNLPAPVAANIVRFLRIIRARRRWEARFGVSVAPDSNLNTASGTRRIWLDTPFGRLPFTRQGGHRAEIRPRYLRLGRRRIPGSARSALAAARRGGRLDPRIQGRPVRRVFHRCLSRAALAYRCPDGREPARHRAAAMDRRPAEHGPIRVAAGGSAALDPAPNRARPRRGAPAQLPGLRLA